MAPIVFSFAEINLISLGLIEQFSINLNFLKLFCTLHETLKIIIDLIVRNVTQRNKHMVEKSNIKIMFEKNFDRKNLLGKLSLGRIKILFLTFFILHFLDFDNSFFLRSLEA